MKNNTSVNLDKDILKWLVEMAKKDDRSKSYIVNKILKERKEDDPHLQNKTRS